MKDKIKEHMLKLKCEQRIQSGPDYELNYEIKYIDKDKNNQTATVYCMIYESFSKEEETKERKAIVYFAWLNREWTIIEKCGASMDVLPQGKCLICGELVDENQKFCPSCGFCYEREKICSKCGSELSPTQKFCGNCGNKIE